MPVFLICTDAFGIAARLASVTRPVTVARKSWANAEAVINKKQSAIRKVTRIVLIKVNLLVLGATGAPMG